MSSVKLYIFCSSAVDDFAPLSHCRCIVAFKFVPTSYMSTYRFKVIYPNVFFLNVICYHLWLDSFSSQYHIFTFVVLCYGCMDLPVHFVVAEYSVFSPVHSHGSSLSLDGHWIVSCI